MSAEGILFDLLVPQNYNISSSCIWTDIFDNEQRRYYNVVYFWISVLSHLVLTWFNMALYQTSLWNETSYRYLALFTVSADYGRLITLISSFWDQSYHRVCVFFAYVNSFFGMLEVEGLTHACIARFVMARYAAKGWPLNQRFFEYFVCSTLGFAAFYTFLPLTGYGGSYDYDFTCTTCTYSPILPDGNIAERVFIMFLFFMRYVKPVLMMLIMLISALYLEKNVCRDDGRATRIKFTWMMFQVACMYVGHSGLLASVRFFAIWNQLNTDDDDDMLHFFINGVHWIKWSYWLHALWPVTAVSVMMWYDERIRYNMIHVQFATEAFKRAKRQQEQRVAAEKYLCCSTTAIHTHCEEKQIAEAEEQKYATNALKDAAEKQKAATDKQSNDKD